MSGRGIDWDAQPLGVESDTEIARRVGCTRSAVSWARRKRSIPSPRLIIRPKCDPSEFAAELIGAESDRVIAERHGLASRQVAYARRKLGRQPKRKRWDALPLGSAPDNVIARNASGYVGNRGHGSNPARLARVRLGIPAWSGTEERTCPCGSAFRAFHQRQRYCSYRCQRYRWQLVNRKGMPEEAADCAIAVWAFKRSMKGR